MTPKKEILQNRPSITFLIDKYFRITSGLDRSSTLIEEKVSAEELQIKDLKEVFRFPILYMISKAQVERIEFLDEFFERKGNNGSIYCFYIEVNKYNEFGTFEVSVTSIDNHEIRYPDATQNKENFNTRLISLKLDELIKDEKSLLSLKRELYFERDKIEFRLSQFEKARKEFRLLADNSPQSTILIDRFNSVVQYNRKAAELINKLFNTRLQKGLVITSIFSAKDSTIFRRNVNDITSGKERNLQTLLYLTSANNESIIIQLDFSAFENDFNENNFISISISDVSDQLITKKVNFFSNQIMREALDPSKTINEISNLFIEKYEDLFSNTYCSILLISDNYFEHLSSPSFPTNFFHPLQDLSSKSFRKLIKTLYSKKVLHTKNLQSEKSWSYLRSSLVDFDIESCTQFPIINNGEIIALFNVFRKDNFILSKKDIDISEQMLGLISLIFEMIRQKNKHKSLLKSIQDGFFSVNSNNEIIYWNKTAERLTKVDREEAMGTDFLTIFNFPNKDQLSSIKEIIEKRVNKTFKAFIPNMGKWIEFIFYPNESSSWAVFFRDISDRQQKERYIIDTNQRLENILNTVNDAVYEVNLEDDLIYWSNGYNEIFGYYNQDNVNSTKEFFKYIHEKDRQLVEKLYREALIDKNQSILKLEYSYKRKDGSFAHVVDQAKIIRNNEGKAQKIIGAVTDISLRKEYEESLETMNRELQQRAKELKESNLELEQFAYLASHDLQEPLRTITSFISKIDRTLGDQIDKKTQSYLNFVTEGAARMRLLVTDLLKYSQFGKSPLELEKISMEHLIGTVKRSLQKEIEDNSADIIHTNLPTIISSDSQLFQIFSNLISNSIKYRKQHIQPIIKIEHRETINDDVFIVSDNGVGIPEEFQKKVFEIFKRLHTSQEHSGTGIGLAIVKKSTEALKGKIILSSSEKGTSVKIILPKHIL